MGDGPSAREGYGDASNVHPVSNLREAFNCASRSSLVAASPLGRCSERSALPRRRGVRGTTLKHTISTKLQAVLMLHSWAHCWERLGDPLSGSNSEGGLQGCGVALSMLYVCAKRALRCGPFRESKLEAHTRLPRSNPSVLPGSRGSCRQRKADIPDILTKKPLLATSAAGCCHDALCPSFVSLSALSGLFCGSVACTEPLPTFSSRPFLPSLGESRDERRGGSQENRCRSSYPRTPAKNPRPVL
jgi:hypothetical protein